MKAGYMNFNLDLSTIITEKEEQDDSNDLKEVLNINDIENSSEENF